MEPIKGRESRDIVNTTYNSAQKVKSKVTKSVTDGISIIAAIFLVFIAIVVFITDIDITDLDMKMVLSISSTIVILWFCSFGMYANCADAGGKTGKKNDLYTDAVNKYNKLKDDIVNQDSTASRLAEFCEWYILDELESTRRSILSTCSISYEDYVLKYIGKGKSDLKKYSLTKKELKAVLSANALKPIKLNPDSIMRIGRNSARNRRRPIGVSPATKRGVFMGWKAISSLTMSLFISSLIFDVVETPTWATFAQLCMKLLPIGWSAFRGFYMGYKNIVVDTVNYVQDQSDLMGRCLKYFDSHPIEKDEGNAT